MSNIIVNIYFCICAIVFVPNVFTQQSTTNDNFYTAAVVDYANEFDTAKTANLNIERNLQEYSKLIRQAKGSGADIIVFPEYGLTSCELSNEPSEVLPFTSLIPDPAAGMSPCKLKERSETIRQWSVAIENISCEAYNNKIYVVVNLPERYKDNSTKEEKWLIYNTNVVFNREGTIVSRYRKYNLFKEYAFNSTSIPDISIFHTDFGVTFGMITCFDLLFATPTLLLLRSTNITDIVYPVAWFSELPFLTAVQTQAGWARAYGVNLLAAGYDDPEKYQGGSGIYSADIGILNFTIPAVKHTSLLISKLPKLDPHNPDIYINRNHLKKQYHHKPQERSLRSLKTLKDNFTSYTTEVIKKNVDNYKLCHKNFCCQFTVKMQKENRTDYYYMMTVYDGPRLMGDNTVRVQFCGVVACATEDKTSCGERTELLGNTQIFNEIYIKGQFSPSNYSVHFPTTVSYDLIPLDFTQYSYITDVAKDFKPIELKTLGPIERILTVGIYAKIDANSGTYSFIVTPILVAFLCVLNFIR